jgi:hypothetical protein
MEAAHYDLFADLGKGGVPDDRRFRRGFGKRIAAPDPFPVENAALPSAVLVSIAKTLD